MGIISKIQKITKNKLSNENIFRIRHFLKKILYQLCLTNEINKRTMPNKSVVSTIVTMIHTDTGAVDISRKN